MYSETREFFATNTVVDNEKSVEIILESSKGFFFFFLYLDKSFVTRTKLSEWENCDNKASLNHHRFAYELWIVSVNSCVSVNALNCELSKMQVPQRFKHGAS